MYVIIEDHPRVNFQFFVQATIFERLDQEIASRRRGEDGQPSDHGRGDEVGGMGFMRGSVIERMARDARVQAIGGGATEVMLEEVAKRL